ncbi:alginate export family protein [Lysobacter sp. CA199]|uniref:alginate export family protein n=1 Tax=Lysobacter sp. CA199 TaxID=3455608 RepID=UPI003F8D7D6B
MSHPAFNGASRKPWIAYALALLPCVASAQTPPSFKLLAYDEDYRYLAKTEPGQRSAWEQWKYRSVGNEGSLSIGGESRTLFDYRSNPGFGRFTRDDQDGYWQERLRLWADYRVNPHLRLFGELSSSFVSGLDAATVQATDRNTLELSQGFIELSSGEAQPRWRLRTGRQQIAHGWQRLLDVREPPNSRLSFDAVRLLYDRPGFSGGLLWGRPVESRIGGFDDRTNDLHRLWGGHVEVPLLRSAPAAAKLELLYLDTEQRNRRFDASGPANDQRRTLSARLSGANKGFDYDLELIGQRGDFGAQRIRAWQGTLFAGYTFEQAAWKPRLGVRLEASSGDRDPRDGELNTFNGLYSRSAVFDGSFLSSNVRSFGPDLVLKPTPKLWLNLYVLALQRQSVHDGVYGAGWRVVRPGAANDERDIGVRKVLAVKYRINTYATLDLFVHHADAGPFLRDGAVRGRDYFFFAPYLTLRF